MGALLIRLLALLGLVWTGKQVFKQVSAAIRPQANADGNAPAEAVNAEMAKDPCCQTFLPKALAIQKNIQGETYYFCSEECAAKFAAQRQAES